MCKKEKPAAVAVTGMVQAPWLFINDPSPGAPNALAVHREISGSQVFHYSRDSQIDGFGTTFDSMVSITARLRNGSCDKTVSIICTNNSSCDTSLPPAAAECRDQAIKHGANFVSVNLYFEGEGDSKPKDWGSNHYSLCVKNLPVTEVASKIKKWMLTVLTVPETLHLIPAADMLKTNKAAFPDYDYCPLAEAGIRPKDAKIQFVALIASKPVIHPGGKAVWTVVDRTGSANFYFVHRGKLSDTTWEWILKLKVGERVALPRMPCVHVVESRTKRIVKGPFRLASAMVIGTGVCVSGIGRGIKFVGKKAGKTLGKKSEWVPKEDIVDGAKVDWDKKWDAEKREREQQAKTLEKAKEAREKTIDDKTNLKTVASDASSLGSAETKSAEWDEKLVKDFC